jgi:hypothetical protein
MSLSWTEWDRHARMLSPYPPLYGGGALGVSGIQSTDKQLSQSGRWIPAKNLRE